MKAVIPILIAGFAAVVAGFIVFNPLHDADAEYRAANAEILSELAHPPGVTVIEQKQTASYDEGTSFLIKNPTGWTLNVLYRPPLDMPAEEIIAFYRENVPAGWRLEVEERPIIALDTGEQLGVSVGVVYRRDDDLVVFNFDNLATEGNRSYEVAVDQKARSFMTSMAPPLAGQPS